MKILKNTENTELVFQPSIRQYLSFDTGSGNTKSIFKILV